MALGLRSKLNRIVWTAPPGFGARRLWLAFTALSAFSVGRRLWSSFRGRTRKPSETVAVSTPVEGDGAAWTTAASDSVARRSTEDIIQYVLI